MGSWGGGAAGTLGMNETRIGGSASRVWALMGCAFGVHPFYSESHLFIGLGVHTTPGSLEKDAGNKHLITAIFAVKNLLLGRIGCLISA
jgi:hypothetical protein